MSMSKPSDPEAGCKNKNKRLILRRGILAFKLERTDTTLDLSQKAKRAGEQKGDGCGRA